MAHHLVIEDVDGYQESIQSEERLMEVLTQKGLSSEMLYEATVASDRMRSDKETAESFRTLQSNANRGKRSLSFTTDHDELDIKTGAKELFSQEIIFDSVRLVNGQYRRVKLVDLQALKDNLGISNDIDKYLKKRNKSQKYALSWDSRFVEVGSYADYVLMLVSILEALGEDSKDLSGDKVVTAKNLIKKLAKAVESFEAREKQKTQIAQAMTDMNEASHSFVVGSLANRLLQEETAMQKEDYFKKENRYDTDFLRSLLQIRGVSGSELEKEIINTIALREQEDKHSDYVQKLTSILQSDVVQFLRRSSQIEANFAIIEGAANAILLGITLPDHEDTIKKSRRQFDQMFGSAKGLLKSSTESQTNVSQSQRENGSDLSDPQTDKTLFVSQQENLEENLVDQSQQKERYKSNLRKNSHLVKQWSQKLKIPTRIVGNQEQAYLFVMENEQVVMLVSQEFLERGLEGYREDLRNRLAIEKDAQEIDLLKREMQHVDKRSMDDILRTAMLLSKSFNFHIFGDFMRIMEAFASGDEDQLRELYRYESRYYYETLTNEYKSIDDHVWKKFVQVVVERGRSEMDFKGEDFQIFLKSHLPENSLLSRLSTNMNKQSFVDLVQALSMRRDYQQFQNRFFKETAYFTPDMYRPFRDSINGISNIAAVNGTLNNRRMILNDNFSSLMELAQHT